jgi:hypothetical protein
MVVIPSSRNRHTTASRTVGIVGRIMVEWRRP